MRSLRYWPRTSPLLNPRSKFFTAILAEKNWSPSECAKRGCSGIPMGPEFVPDFVLSSTSELPISENKFQIPVSWCKHLEKLAATSERFTGADIAGVCMKAGLFALRDNPEARSITMEHFFQAVKEEIPSVKEEMIKEYEKLARKVKQESMRIGF
jgi:hypothetical protein